MLSNKERRGISLTLLNGYILMPVQSKIKRYILLWKKIGRTVLGLDKTNSQPLQCTYEKFPYAS